MSKAKTALIQVTADGKKQYRWIHSSHTYKSGSALEAHVGLGRANAANVAVTRLNGQTKTFANVAADTIHYLTIKHP